MKRLIQSRKSASISEPLQDSYAGTDPQTSGLSGPPNFTAGFTPEDVDAWQAVPLSTRAEWNRKRIGQLLIPWDNLCNAPTNFGSKAKTPLVFLHLTKTGGTTLEYLIGKNHPVGETLYAHGGELIRNPAILKKVGAQGRVPRFLMGHYDLCNPLYQVLNLSFAHITMLREPVGRVLSWYNFLRSRPNHDFHSLAKSHTLREFIESEKVSERIKELDNGQTLRLTYGLHLDYVATPKIGEETLQIAKDNLVNCFSFFGIQDQYNEFLLMAQKLLGWADIFYQRRNVSRRGLRIDEIDDATLACIREKNLYDLELYEYAKKLFNERCQQLAITPDKAQIFKRANKQYADLISTPL